MPPSDTIAAVAPVVGQLERLAVPYYLGGSVASSAYGVPRSTLDVDLVADLSEEHVAPLVEGLRETYYVNVLTATNAVARRSCFNLIHLATSFKVDVFPAKRREYDREVFRRCKAKSIDADDPTVQFRLASAEDTVLSKLEWFRLGNEVSQRQWSDVLGVLKVQETSLDRAYLERWAGELGVGDLLNKAWREVEV